jgi:hypothetical protein
VYALSRVYAKEAIMAILKSRVNNEIKGFAANKQLRNALNVKLNETSIVINKVEINFNNKTKEYSYVYKYGTVGYSPVFEEFGIDRDYKATNVPVEVDLDNDLTITRRIDINGLRYAYCDSIMSIECKEKQMIEKLDRDGFELNGHLYRVLGASPSQEKHGVKFYYKVTEEVPNERAAFNKMDLVSGMVFSESLRIANGKQISKANTRWGNYLTTMRSLAQIDLQKDYIMVVHGSINGACDFNDKTKEAMDKAGLEIDCNINDGAMYFSPFVVQEIAKNLGLTLSEEDALKVALQVRVTYITSKCMSRTMTDKQLKQLAAFGKAKPYGNTNGRLALVVDTDGAKMLNMKALKEGKGVLDVMVMAMAKASNPSTSGQHLIKYMAVDSKATLEFINKTTKENLEQYIMQQVEEGKGITAQSNLTKALGEEAFANKVLVEGMINDSFKYIQSAIAKCKLTIPALYSHMMFDATYALTNGIVRNILGITANGIVEAYSADILRMYAKEIAAIENDDTLTEEQKEEKLFTLLSGTVIKYPSAGNREYELIVYQTEKQMKAKIQNKVSEAVAELEINNEDKKSLVEELVEALTEYFNNTPWGTTVYAPVNAMKNKLAGADCDFDATMCDMSELKFILINKRLEEQKQNPGFMGDCVYISYKNIDRTPVQETKEEDVLGNTDEQEF